MVNRSGEHHRRRALKAMTGLVLALFWFITSPVPPARGATTPAEDSAFNTAAKAYNDGLNELAEKQLGAFTSTYTNSERIPEAILMRATARFRLKQYEEAVNLLNANLNRGGKIADKFRFLMGESYFQKGDYASAVTMYAQMVKDYPDSFLRANASYGEAMAWFKLGNLTNVIARLVQPDGPFQKAAQAQPNDPCVLQGNLLLAKAWLERREFKSAEETLSKLANRQLPAQLAWQRQYLLVQVLLASGQAGTALNHMTNLWQAATNTGSLELRADTVMLQADLYQTLRQPAAALQVFEQNLETLPPPQRRQALLKTAELNLGQQNITKAINGLEAYLTQYPQDTNLDQVRLSLGELHLKEFARLQQTPPSTNAQVWQQAVTNALHQAQTNFSLVITNYPRSGLVGQAYLDRGWCWWHASNWVESEIAFKAATEHLPLSTNQALARFKWADAQFHLKDYTNANLNFHYILDHYTNQAALSPALQEETLYQIVRTSLNLNDLPGAIQALEKLLTLSPKSEFGDRCLLLVGQKLSREGKPAEARERFADLHKRFPNSPLAPEALLAAARSYILETRWTNAISVLDGWVSLYATNSALPQVEFERAWANYQAGEGTNALFLFTNFVVHFPHHALAPVAQYWVGTYYENRASYSQPLYQEAEKNYQKVYQNTNWPGGELAYQAELSAARVALKRRGYSDANDYLTMLINQLNRTNSSPALLSEAWFALGDTLSTWAKAPGVEATNSVKRFSEAINAFAHIKEPDPMVPLAWGRIADCHFQLAAQEPARYPLAIEFYQKVVGYTNASVAARSQAEVGLGSIYEKLANAPNKPPAEQQSLLTTALEHYMNVVYLKLRPGEQPDAFWLARAGQDAVRLLEAQGKWEAVVNLYQRLSVLLPSQRPSYEKKLELARKRL